MTDIRIKKIEITLNNCHKAAMDYIDMVTAAAINQLQSEGIQMNVEEVHPSMISRYAAKNLNIEYTEKFYEDFLDLLVLEKMVEMS